MWHTPASFVIAATVLASAPAAALAGMPVVYLNDVGTMRLETLSFFAVIFFSSSWVIQKIWNGLSRDFPWLPRLGYWRAVGLVAIWGLLFLVVLTMISGARELFTPGAWEKVGFTYKLAEYQAEEIRAITPLARREKLERLRSALWAYASAHGGKMPSSSSSADIASEFWQTPDSTGVRYGYVGDLTVHVGTLPLAFEPPVFAGDPLVLFTNGDIRAVPTSELDKLLVTSTGAR